MAEQVVPHGRSETRRRLRGKILGRQRTHKTDHTQQDQHPAAPENVDPVLIADSHVNDLGHNKRNKKLKTRFEHLK